MTRHSGGLFVIHTDCAFVIFGPAQILPSQSVTARTQKFGLEGGRRRRDGVGDWDGPELWGGSREVLLGLVGIHRDTMRNFGSCEFTALQRPFLVVGHLMIFSTVFDSQEFHVLGYLGLLDKCGTCWYQHCPKKSLKLRPGFSARARAPSWLTPSGGCALRLWLHVNGATTVPNYVCRP